MKITPKQNYLMMLNGEVPEYIPSFFEPSTAMLPEPLLTPVMAPNGPVFSSYGVKFVGSPENNWGAMPEPGFIILDDITKWRDVIKNPDLSEYGEDYFTKKLENVDRENLAVCCGGGDYFQTLVSFMGFEGALMAMYEEPEEVYALLDYVSEFYVGLAKKHIYYCKPDIYGLPDDDSAYRAPFFSVQLYRDLIKPFHKKHCDLALESGAKIDRHDCGKCEQFIDDWIEMGVVCWNPAQVSNDLIGIKKKYGSKLTLCGCWDNQGPLGRPDIDRDVLVAALDEYVANFAPGGGFIFSAMTSGDPKNPMTEDTMNFIKDYYYANVKDYYKTH